MQKIFQLRMFMADWPLFAAYVPLFFVQRSCLSAWRYSMQTALIEAYTPPFYAKHTLRKSMNSPHRTPYLRHICRFFICSYLKTALRSGILPERRAVNI